jgi:hypothetical protein
MTRKQIESAIILFIFLLVIAFVYTGTQVLKLFGIGA